MMATANFILNGGDVLLALLDKLAQIEPATIQRASVRNPELFEIVKKHFDEISQAKQKGYSWRQITETAVKAWQETGEWKNDAYWDESFIYNYYYKIKREFQKLN